MDGAPHMPASEFRRLGHELVDWIAQYLDTLDDKPVSSSIEPGELFHALPASPPEKGEDWADILRDFERLILPAVAHWQSPNFHAYFPCNNSAPAILGELLSAGLGINGFLWQCSPAITELEMRVMDWLAQALALPPQFRFESRDHPDYARSPGGGVILGTASEAVLTALVAARHRAATDSGATEPGAADPGATGGLSASATPSPSPGATGGLSASATPSPSPGATGGLSASATPSPSPGATGGLSASATPSPSPGATGGLSASATPSPSPGATGGLSASATPFTPSSSHAAIRNPQGPLTAYCSSQAHSSVIKAAMIAGIGRENVRLIDVDGSLAMRPDALAEAIRRDRAAGFTPCFICATVGTTSTGAVDPLRAVGEVVRREAPRAWIHVDAAWAGAACLCPEFRPIIDGVELVDSFNFNPHKWLLTNFDCSAFWTRDRESLIRSLSISPEYLRNPSSESGRTIEYRDWQIPLGRRFRALKLWFVLRHYGVAGLRAHIREHVRLAEVFEGLIRADQRFEMPAPRNLSLVCFRLKGPDELTRRLFERINATRTTLLTHTIAPLGPAGEARYLIRMAIGSPRTHEHHVRAAWDLIRAHADRIRS